MLDETDEGEVGLDPFLRDVGVAPAEVLCVQRSRPPAAGVLRWWRSRRGVGRAADGSESLRGVGARRSTSARGAFLGQEA